MYHCFSKYFSNLRIKGTCIGIIAPIFWSFTGVFSNVLMKVPGFELLCSSFLFTLIFLISFQKIRLTFCFKLPKMLVVASLLGISINPICYLIAFRYAPCEQVDLINYFWPVLLLLSAVFFPHEKIKYRHLIAAAIGFLGIIILVLKVTNNNLFSGGYIIGYLLAFFSAITWVIFSITIKFYKIKVKDIMASFSFIGFIITLILHFSYESFYMPTTFESIVLVIMGVGSMGLAYVCWDYGMKVGSLPVLSISSYCIPIVSIVLMVVFGYSELTLRLVIATLLISFASYLSFSKYFDKQIKINLKRIDFKKIKLTIVNSTKKLQKGLQFFNFVSSN